MQLEFKHLKVSNADVIKPFLKLQNKSFFDRPIIPTGLEMVPSEYQYTDFTSETTEANRLD